MHKKLNTVVCALSMIGIMSTVAVAQQEPSSMDNNQVSHEQAQEQLPNQTQAEQSINKKENRNDEAHLLGSLRRFSRSFGRYCKNVISGIFGFAWGLEGGFKEHGKRRLMSGAATAIIAGIAYNKYYYGSTELITGIENAGNPTDGQTGNQQTGNELVGLELDPVPGAQEEEKARREGLENNGAGGLREGEGREQEPTGAPVAVRVGEGAGVVLIAENVQSPGNVEQPASLQDTANKWGGLSMWQYAAKSLANWNECCAGGKLEQMSSSEQAEAEQARRLACAVESLYELAGRQEEGGSLRTKRVKMTRTLKGAGRVSRR